MTHKEKDEVLKAFKTWINKIGDLSDGTWKVGLGLMHIRKVKKGTCLLKYGQAESHFRFIHSGIVKCEYHEEDASFVNDFSIGPSACSETISFNPKSVDKSCSLTTITPVILVEIKRTDIISHFGEYPDFQKLVLAITSQKLFEVMGRMSKMRLLKAEARYHYWTTNYPDIIKYVKLEDLASFLNIIPSSLSRIRSNAIKNKMSTLKSPNQS